MKKIKATNDDVFILVDDEDYPFLCRFPWHLSGHGYAQMSVGREKIAMHRFLLNCGYRKGVVDHIDGNRVNNQKSNLRLVNCSTNQQNIKKKSDLGLRGVSHEGKSYKANIKINGKKKHLGTFKCPFEAAAAYDKAALEHYGPDAMTNRKILSKIFDDSA